jgi:hypothetical protein
MKFLLPELHHQALFKNGATMYKNLFFAVSAV